MKWYGGNKIPRRYSCKRKIRKLEVIPVNFTIKMVAFSSPVVVFPPALSHTSLSCFNGLGNSLHTYLYLHQVYRLHESWLSSELAGVQDPTSCGNNLASTTVDGVSVQRHIMNVEANSPHILLTESTLQDEDKRYKCVSNNLNGNQNRNTTLKCICGQVTAAHLFSRPLEPGHHAVLDLVEVLNPLCHIYQQVRPVSFWTKAPDLLGFCHVPVIRVCKVT